MKKIFFLVIMSIILSCSNSSNIYTYCNSETIKDGKYSYNVSTILIDNRKFVRILGGDKLPKEGKCHITKWYVEINGIKYSYIGKMIFDY